jgi:hypothetical protein
MGRTWQWSYFLSLVVLGRLAASGLFKNVRLSGAVTGWYDNSMPESTKYPQSGTKNLASAFLFSLNSLPHGQRLHNYIENKPFVRFLLKQDVRWFEHQTIFPSGNRKQNKINKIDSNESIPPAYVAWRAGTTTLFLLGS